jgi:hypothetical protein
MACWNTLDIVWLWASSVFQKKTKRYFPLAAAVLIAVVALLGFAALAANGGSNNAPTAAAAKTTDTNGFLDMSSLLRGEKTGGTVIRLKQKSGRIGWVYPHKRI